MFNFKKKGAQRGITLLEILIASALGTVIVIGSTNSMTILSRNSEVQQGQDRLQDTADLALSYVGMRMRNSMSTPCNQMDALKQLSVNNIEGGTGANNISVGEDTAIRSLVTGKGVSISSSAVTVDNVNVTSDNITLISAQDRMHLNGESGMPAANAVTTLTLNGSFPSASNDNDSLYVITNCEEMDVFRASRAAVTSGTALTTKQNTTFSVNYRGSESAMISRFSASIIGVDANGNLYDRPLYSTSAGNTLMNDVEIMRVLFAVDTSSDGQADRYMTSSQLAALAPDARVLSADIFLLVRNSSANMAIPNSYELRIPDTSSPVPNTGVIPMQTLTVTDNVMRKVFSRTITFRNNVTL